MIEDIRAKGWRQGSIFPAAAHTELAKHTRVQLSPDDCCIVLTQSCDIVFPDFDVEPVVEVVSARWLNSPTDGNFTHARSARRLHFHVAVRGAETGYEAHIRDRFNAPRELLARYAPDDIRGLPDTDYNDLITWIVARYERHAFPDAFNDRIRVATEQKIKPILKKLPKIKALFLALDSWDELSDKTAYRMDLVVTLNAEDYDNVAVRQAVEKGTLEISSALADCKGVIVDEANVRSERDVSLDMLRYAGRWNFDYMSLKEPAKHAQPGPTQGKPRA